MVSSRENWAHRLVDESGLFWESCGPKEKHWIRLEIHQDIIIKSLKILIDPLDNSYMPSLIIVYGGDSFSSLIELATVNIRNTDTIVSLLTDVKEFYACIEIAIKQCWNGGINCKIHSLMITGKKRLVNDELPLNASFLASDFEEVYVNKIFIKFTSFLQRVI